MIPNVGAHFGGTVGAPIPHARSPGVGSGVATLGAMRLHHKKMGASAQLRNP